MRQQRQAFSSTLHAADGGGVSSELHLPVGSPGAGGAGPINWDPGGPGAGGTTGDPWLSGEGSPLHQDFSGGWQQKGGKGGGGFTNWAAYLYANPLTKATQPPGGGQDDSRTPGMKNLDTGLNNSYFGQPPAPTPAPTPTPAPGGGNSPNPAGGPGNIIGLQPGGGFGAPGGGPQPIPWWLKPGGVPLPWGGH